MRRGAYVQGDRCQASSTSKSRSGGEQDYSQDECGDCMVAKNRERRRPSEDGDGAAVVVNGERFNRVTWMEQLSAHCTCNGAGQRSVALARREPIIERRKRKSR